MSLFSSLLFSHPHAALTLWKSSKICRSRRTRGFVLSVQHGEKKIKKKSTYAAIHASLAEKVLFRAWTKINKEKNQLQQSLQSAKMAHLGASRDVRLPIKPSAPASIWAQLIAARQAWEGLIRTTRQERKICHGFQKKQKNKRDYSAISAAEPSNFPLHWGPWRSRFPEAKPPFFFYWRGAEFRIRSHVGEKRI